MNPSILETLAYLGFSEWATGGGCAMMRFDIGSGFFLGVTGGGGAELPSDEEDSRAPFAFVFLAHEDTFNEGSPWEERYDTKAEFYAGFVEKMPRPGSIRVEGATMVSVEWTDNVPEDADLELMTWDGFREANADCPTMLGEARRALEMGQEFKDGGGATPPWTLKLAEVAP